MAFLSLLATAALTVASPCVSDNNESFLVDRALFSSTAPVLPDDPFFTSGYQWGLNGTWGINAPAVWEYTTGSKDVRVGIIDSGIAFHSDLVDNLVEGWDFFNGDCITNDDSDGHGTFVAGIVGAKGNNNQGVCGVCWDVSLVPLQISGMRPDVPVSGARPEAAVAAIDYASSLWGTAEQIDILNISAFDLYDRVADLVLRKATSFPGLVVWAAGNSHKDLDDRPSGTELLQLDNLVIVGAMTSYPSIYGRSNYSSSGENVHVYAPGSYVYSTDVYANGEELCHPDDGTSFAAPFVTGLAALMMSYHPSLMASQIKQAIIANAPRRQITLSSGETVTMKRVSGYLAMSAAAEMHSHRERFVSMDERQHKAFCHCGHFVIAPHAVSMSRSYRIGGRLYAPCIDCGQVVCIDTTPIISPTFFSDGRATANGSYVFPDGTLVISDADMEAYQNGDLVFAGAGEEI